MVNKNLTEWHKKILDKDFEIMAPKTLEQHKKALIHLYQCSSGYENVKPLTNTGAMTRMIAVCNSILNTDTTHVFKYRLLPAKYHAYKNKTHCFEINALNINRNIFVLTVNGVKFDCRNYDAQTALHLRDLWYKAKQKDEIQNQR